MRRASECRGSAISNYENEKDFDIRKYFDLFNSLLKSSKKEILWFLFEMILEVHHSRVFEKAV